jgi:hypothetical protein
MAAFKKFVSTFRTAARLFPLPVMERRVAHPRNNRFMTIEVRTLKCQIRIIILVSVVF